MQFKNSLFLAVATSILALGTASKRNPSNPPLVNTGAPNETTCQKSGCHSGGSYAGTVTISGLPDTIQFSTTYNLTITNTSNAIRSGFQLTCLDGNNAKCGTLVAATGVNVANQNTNSRQYARQSAYKVLSGGSVSWSFSWKSPATASGNKATFYFASLCANGNGNNGGDNVLTGNKAVVFNTSVAASEPEWAAAVKIFPTVADKQISVALPENAVFSAVIFSNDGRQIQKLKLNSSLETVDVSGFSPGIYFLKMSKDGQEVTRKFVKN